MPHKQVVMLNLIFCDIETDIEMVDHWDDDQEFGDSMLSDWGQIRGDSTLIDLLDSQDLKT